MASASRLVTLSRALARAPSSAVHTAGLRAFANAASRAGKGGSANASATAAGGKGRASAALSHEISVESLQQEFEHSSSSEEVVAAERDSIDPMMLARQSNTIAPSSVADSSPDSETEPQHRASGGEGTQTAQGFVDPGVKPIDMAKKSRAAMNRSGDYLEGGSRARGGADQVREG